MVSLTEKQARYRNYIWYNFYNFYGIVYLFRRFAILRGDFL
jgi:predicted LPLAT superfamily acyltransferase